jgi:putative RecB family exonuclease
VDEIPAPIRGIELHLGVSVHAALERLYLEVREGRTPSFDEVLSFYVKQWVADYSPELRIVRAGTTARDYFETGRHMLRNYYRRFHPFTQSATLGLEDEFLVPLSTDHDVRGIIDRISKAEDGSLEIHDYKTSRRLPNDSQVDADFQLALYELALRHRWPEAAQISLIWHYLAFDKDIRITKTAEQLQTVRQNTLFLIESIVSAKEFPPNVTALCDWCEYKRICPAMPPMNDRRASASTVV